MPLQDKSLIERLYPKQFIKRFTVWCGALAPFIGVATLVAASQLIPGFSWTQDQLAALGNNVHTYFWVYKAGMTVAGIVSIPFAHTLWTASEQPLKRSATLLYLACSISLIALGYLPFNHDSYLSVELGTQFLLLYTLFLFGTGEILDGKPRHGLATIWLGIAGTTVWFAWIGGMVSGSGSAVPEAAGLLALFAWMTGKAAQHNDGLLGDLVTSLIRLRDEISSRLPL